jgi:hypothetical protein
MIKSRFFSLIMLILLSLSACDTPTASPAITSLPALPTPAVPERAVIESSIQRWENSGNTNYYLEVEERTPSRHVLMRIVVVDGDVRAAQILDRSSGSLGEPEPLLAEEARQYTATALLERVFADATGRGAVPYNMQVIFNQSMGFPEVVRADALPTYSEAGIVRLNREYSYTLTATIKALIEDTANPGQQPILKMTRSNGPQAWCDSLQIYPDGRSQYSNDCLQTSLPLEVAEPIRQELETLLARFEMLNETRQDGDQIQSLTITGNGTTSPTSSDVEAAWELSERLYELLSYPLGAGVTLIYFQSGQLFGMDMRTQIVQPSRLSFRGTLHGAAVSPDNVYLAYGDDAGLRVMTIATGEVISLLAAPGDGSVYMPRAWNLENRLLVTRVPSEPTGAYQHGWIDLEDRRFTSLPLPEGVESYGCDTGIAWSPDGTRIAITGQGDGAPCNLTSGLTVVDLVTGQAAQIVAKPPSGPDDQVTGARHPAWSPDGQWIAFSLNETTNTSSAAEARLYVVQPNGRALAPISSNSRGRADYPVWTPDGLLFYSITGANTADNGVYQYDRSGAVTTYLLTGENLRPDSVSPHGEFMAYFDGESIMIYAFPLNANLPQPVRSLDGEPITIAGWLSAPR